MPAERLPHVAMLGPHLDARGGISSVARTWLATRAIRAARVEYHATVDSSPRPARAAGMVRAQLAFLGRLAGGWRPDVVHAHASYFTSFYRKLLYGAEAAALGIPVIVHLHAPDIDGFLRASPLHPPVVREALARAARVVVLSRHMARELGPWLDDRARVEVLHNPVDIERFRPAARRPPRPPTVLFAGRVGERKGTFELVAAWERVVRALPAARLLVAGDGELDRLRAEVARRRLSHAVDVLGWVSGDEAAALYGRADVYCLPSHHEGLPMGVLEAMAAGLPVVSTPVAGIPEAVEDGSTGILVAPGDVDALAGALLRLLRDAGLRARMGAAGRRRAEREFDAEGRVARIVETWREVAGEGAGTASGPAPARC